MILSNMAMFEALEDGRLLIEPEPAPRPADSLERSPFGTTSVDLRLGPTLQIPKDGLSVAIDLRRGNVAQTLTSLSDTFDLEQHQSYQLLPQQLVLGQTLERVSLPLPAAWEEGATGRPCLAARVEGKSSRARFGLLIHFTAPTIHAGWAGPITLEIMNLGPAPIILFPGMPICQLILEEVSGSPFENPSSFHGQVTPAGQR